MRFLTFILVTSLLQGCASSQLVSDDYSLAKASESGFGLVAVSLRLDSQCDTGVMQAAAINFSAPGGVLAVINPFLKDDFSNPRGLFLIRKLPAKTYTLNSTEHIGPKGDYRERIDPPITFDVKVGTVQYLGEIYIREPACGDFRYTINDQSKRDGALFNQSIKAISSDHFQIQLLKSN